MRGNISYTSNKEQVFLHFSYDTSVPSIHILSDPTEFAQTGKVPSFAELLELYDTMNLAPIVITIQLNHWSTATIKVLLDLFTLMENTSCIQKSIITWLYANEDQLEWGEELVGLIGLEVVFKEV